MRVKHGFAVALAGAGIGALVLNGPAAAAAGGGWTETSTGQVALMSVAQPSPSVTLIGGTEITTDPDTGAVGFTPRLLQRDTAAGGGWQQLPIQGGDAWNSRINDIATAPDGSAFFVGDQRTGGGALVGRYAGGAWRATEDGGLPAGTVDASLLSVSALSWWDAWAVGQGYEKESGAAIPVVEHWDGRRWTSVQIPGSAHWSVNQVDEVAPDDVWVVGVDEDDGQSLAVHWDGHAWTRTATPLFPDSAVLFDVVARTPDDVWAVGWSRDTDKQRPAGLALHWDGAAWSQVPLPAGTFGLQGLALQPHGAVVVIGGNDDAAVGLRWTPAAGWQSLGLPENDPQLPLGVGAVASSGSHLTVAGWHYVSSDGGDSFAHGVILTR
ncbi:hypothetical protein [Actinacidiphila bryophytorum]|uniref:hypothetical protein n=1 Tax=Actinacidiphila bryophytorum TaxID=1436133 RepID=UPI002176C23A|nr:hypothetical protein [Actinacidiphila bryophytorum]UWE10934.1 hypothetical protein NYE86_20930 [Actinacidiphila bryophytorum]